MVVLREEARNSLGFGAERFKKTRRDTEQAKLWKGQENPGFPVSPQPSLDGARRQTGWYRLRYPAFIRSSNESGFSWCSRVLRNDLAQSKQVLF
ncbi:MAG: hypothetical protein DMG82_16930 [Acidobacteria bacterium]|nr:MAG: hypothetical protein DMG82_16930 [Acidobacteriota bacterium]